MGLRSKLRKFPPECREFGFRFATQKLVVRLVPAKFFRCRKWIIVALDLGTIPRNLECPPDVRWATLDDVDKLTVTGDPPRQIREWLTSGVRILIHERDGRLLGCNGYFVGGVTGPDWIEFSLGAEDVWSFLTWVAPEIRGKGAFAPIRNYALSTLAEEGKTRMLGSIEALNANSLKYSSRGGTTRVGSLVYLKILNLTIYRFPRSIRIGNWGPNKRLRVGDELFFAPNPERQASEGALP